eukprot:TRINITY_DN203_c0_g1_i1.p1 TRINITY_DN203_c0_g1~~TRINITY_DN203_c0_g1_i1.p1  ORF type:complete len:323 (-),score=38.21 TRINITY_DN203_c0_g1_i1:201-1169(-)
MKVLVALCVLFFVGLAVAYPANPRASFIEFQHKYNKVYAAEDFVPRYKIFLDNLAAVEGKNPEVYGITKFMDLTPEEFKSIYLMDRPVDTAAIKATKPSIEVPQVELPALFDWRNKGVVTPVYNQGQCGSCWAFSTTENIESMWALAGNSLTQLSMQQIVDCDTSDDGCNGGDPPTAYQYVQSAGGLEAYSSYPYTAQDGYCQFSSSSVVAQISGWNYATQSQDENAMANFLVQYGPLSICVDAESWQYYNGGVITSGDGCGTSLDHCVMATGFSTQGSNGPYWIVRNSWGTDWGMSGYLFVQMGANVCGIAQEATCSTVSS